MPGSPELRKDPLLEEWVLLAPHRGKRPQDFSQKSGEQGHSILKKESFCPFCPGSERLTPPEIARLPPGSQEWRVRIFPNKYAAVSSKAAKTSSLVRSFFPSLPATGAHEVIVESPSHAASLGSLSLPEWVEVLRAYRERMQVLSAKKGIREVNLFKNWGPEAGASLVHSHTQIIALNHLSTQTRLEQEALAAHRKKHRACYYCGLPEKEKKGGRLIFSGRHLVSLAPFASRYPFEALVLPKKHLSSLSSASSAELFELAFALKTLLSSLESLNLSYNFYLRVPPPGEKEGHLYFRLFSRLAKWGGFEEQTRCIINPLPPEQAASFYRKKFSQASP